MWQLLVPLALWLGTEGVGGTNLTEVQRKGLQVALEEFHKHPPVKWAFQEIGVDSAVDMPLPGGTFVKLEFKLQQTSCPKKNWRKPECKAKSNGRKRKCLACVKLNPEHKVLSRMVHCPIQTPGQEFQEPQCSKVKWAGEDSEGSYFPGHFAFSKGLPPH
ncbi:retinoic acid receptor responder protein 2 [Ctenodactylus gundi]